MAEKLSAKEAKPARSNKLKRRRFETRKDLQEAPEFR